MIYQYSFQQIARLPHPDDNAAIATQRLEAGTVINQDDLQYTLSHTVLEGHRFAVKSLEAGDEILSWSLPFGTALQPIQPGQYLCNTATLAELNSRTISISLPDQPNFADLIRPVTLDADTFTPAKPLSKHEEMRTFMGYRRPGHRGVGTRNDIILLAISAQSGGFVNRLADMLRPQIESIPNIDGILPISHTEAGHSKINNRQLLRRTLAGWIAHPNVAAALIVGFGDEPFGEKDFTDTLRQRYGFEHVQHHFFQINDQFEKSLDAAAEIVRDWLPSCSEMVRTPEPVSELKIALQCGGSDAFSGVSGNPLAGWVAKEVIRYGGAANLGETDELMGAEPYILKMTRDLATAERFLTVLNRFRSWANLHGVSPEGNPSGGNRFRGLYNIALKSIGAANKKDPEVPLDHVINYSDRMEEPGFYFMDSPGNDLESIAGQVAAGCNLIFFVTGNGSITNFPFVPTLKIVTTSDRFNFLKADMDINAGAYLTGTPLEALGADTFELMLNTASGQLSVGEEAGHAQVQIWRDWQLTEKGAESPAMPELFSGEPLAVRVTGEPLPVNGKKLENRSKQKVGLILPTSLCSGQVARMAVKQLNEGDLAQQIGVDRFETLVHTEGCGFSKGAHALFTRSLVGYLQHPMVHTALLLEHGCEKTHNDYFRNSMLDAGLDLADFGWASIQADGGIDQVLTKIGSWFENDSTSLSTGTEGRLTLAILGEIPEDHPLHNFAYTFLKDGGTLILPDRHRMIKHLASTPEMTLGYGQMPKEAGLHMMAMPTDNWAESLTGLGAAGAELILAFSDQHPRPGHSLIPTLHIQTGEMSPFSGDFDLTRETFTNEGLVDLISMALDGRYVPKVNAQGNQVFQMSRGFNGISL